MIPFHHQPVYPEIDGQGDTWPRMGRALTDPPCLSGCSSQEQSDQLSEGLVRTPNIQAPVRSMVGPFPTYRYKGDLVYRNHVVSFDGLGSYRS
ncbi:hypothetical protein Pyn_27609 [Prunus yedoensis var. nudiflora]|uniref:Uncharacterized protein n=1 Tax=Prunus yedoensis var. nudiflora TaxID=2094558 RepID=A0A315A5S7_PRUYE|nr:hypothetical protein Pyn_27609 [Prunus yedoensis var. nudiflora]